MEFIDPSIPSLASVSEEKAWIALALPLNFIKAVSEPSYDKNAFVRDLMVLLSETNVLLDWKCLPQPPFAAQVSQAEMPSVLSANQELSRHTNHPDTGIPFDFFINDQPSLSWAGEVSQFGLAMAKHAEACSCHMNDHAQSMSNVLGEPLRGHVTESIRQEFCQSATNMVKPLYQRIKKLENKNEELEKKIDGVPPALFTRGIAGSDLDDVFQVSDGDINANIVLEEEQILMSSSEKAVMVLVRGLIKAYLDDQNPRLEGWGSEICDKLVVKLAIWGKPTRQIGFWMGDTRKKGMIRCHEWIHLQMEGGSTLVFDPTYVQFVETNQWSWNECKKAVQNCALLFQDDNMRAEQIRRTVKRLPIKLEIINY